MKSCCLKEDFKLDHELTTKLPPHVFLFIHKLNIVMPFRVIKFRKHSPGVLTLMPNLFSCSLSLLLIPTSFSTTGLLKFTFHSRSIPTSVSHPYALNFDPLLPAAFMLMAVLGAALHWWISDTSNAIQHLLTCPRIFFSPLFALSSSIRATALTSPSSSPPLIIVLICSLSPFSLVIPVYFCYENVSSTNSTSFLENLAFLCH